MSLSDFCNRLANGQETSLTALDYQRHYAALQDDSASLVDAIVSSNLKDLSLDCVVVSPTMLPHSLQRLTLKWASKEQFENLLAQVPHLAHLKELTVMTQDAAIDQLEAWKYLASSHVQALTVKITSCRTPVAPATSHLAAVLPQMHSLTELSLGHVHDALNLALQESLPASRITVLRVPATAELLQYIAEPDCPIQTLDVSATRLDKHEMSIRSAQLAQALTSNAALETLIVSKTRLMTSAVWQALANHPCITKIVASTGQATWPQVLPKTVQVLDWSGQTLQGHQLHSVSYLRGLTVAVNVRTDADVDGLVRLVQSPVIKSLELTRLWIPDAAHAERVATAFVHSQLEHLSVPNYSAGASRILEESKIPSLRLRHCTLNGGIGPTIQKLDVTDSKLGDKTLSSLTNSLQQADCQLQWLSLTEHADAVCATLATNVSLQHLVVPELECSTLTRVLPGMKLRSLDFHNSTWSSAETVAFVLAMENNMSLHTIKTSVPVDVNFWLKLNQSGRSVLLDVEVDWVRQLASLKDPSVLLYFVQHSHPNWL